MWILAWEFLLIKSVLHFVILHLLSGYYYYDYVVICVLRPSWLTEIHCWIVYVSSTVVKLTIIIMIKIILPSSSVSWYISFLLFPCANVWENSHAWVLILIFDSHKDSYIFRINLSCFTSSKPMCLFSYIYQCRFLSGWRSRAQFSIARSKILCRPQSCNYLWRGVKFYAAPSVRWWLPIFGGSDFLWSAVDQDLLLVKTLETRETYSRGHD